MAIVHKYDATVDQNSKTFTVPQGKTWRLDWMHVTYTSNATAGNRQINMIVQDSASVERADFHAGAVQAAGVARHYIFQPGMYRETTFVDNSIQVAIPQQLILESGWKLIVKDATNVSATDDFVASFQVTEHSAGTERI